MMSIIIRSSSSSSNERRRRLFDVVYILFTVGLLVPAVDVVDVVGEEEVDIVGGVDGGDCDLLLVPLVVGETMIDDSSDPTKQTTK